ncbi:MAG: DNA methyltransferase [Patescibacteria group bacterium]|nr:site-specific DNA-methyltransferase [Candidatus Magasanikbacteria bacterium]
MTQKPLKLVQQVLLYASKKGDLVLDPFLGSGTMAVVAKVLGRNWVGIEKEKKYVKLASNRVKNYGN